MFLQYWINIKDILKRDKIKKSSIKYLSFSSLDPLGRVFAYRGNILRGIYKNKENYVKTLLECGLYEELVKKELMVDTQLSKYNCDYFSLVLEHKRITSSQPTEWTFSMLRDVASVILKVNKICNKYGYELGKLSKYLCV